MKNYKLTVQYDGSRYNGWQKQGNTANTIQAKLEAVLGKLCKEEVFVIGSGRTDAGVHAQNQTANFKTGYNTSAVKILEYCNQYLPEDIVVKNIEEVPERFHARYNAKRKIYVYYIFNSLYNDAFYRKYAYHVKEKLDTGRMRKAAELFNGEHDFRNFTRMKQGKKSTVKTIYSLNIEQKGSNIKMVFEGSGFLYKMIRMISGTIVEAGLNNISIEEIKRCLECKSENKSIAAAPPHGLFLENVIY